MSKCTKSTCRTLTGLVNADFCVACRGKVVKLSFELSEANAAAANVKDGGSADDARLTQIRVHASKTRIACRANEVARTVNEMLAAGYVLTMSTAI